MIELIKKAERTIVFAAPAISHSVAEAIADRKLVSSNIRIEVILDADPDTLRLGFGEIGGIKILVNNGIEIRTAPSLRVGALIVDKRSWIFAPTPQIILEPANGNTLNAININRDMTDWLIHAMAPRDKIVDLVKEAMDSGPLSTAGSTSSEGRDQGSDDILQDDVINEPGPTKIEDLEPTFGSEWITPEIGNNLLDAVELEALSQAVEQSPPKQFDHEREILVYNGYLQFVEMKFSGGRLASRTIRLPEELLKIVEDIDMGVEIKATCKLFENGDDLVPAIKEFEQKVNDVRRCYTRPLGSDLGSVILASERAMFDEELKDLHEELDDLIKTSKKILEGVIEVNKDRLIKMLMPSLLSNPPDYFKWKVERSEGTVEECAHEYLDQVFSHLMPRAADLLGNMELRCTFKDVTWEMLNEPAFGEAIKKTFPNEKFTKLYSERNTIGETTRPRIITEEDWPDQLDSELNEH